MPGSLSRRLAVGGDDTPRRINRASSPWLAIAVPWAAVMLASTIQTLPLIAAAPILPPLGFLFLIAWRQLRPGLFPVWAGLPLGAFDDLFSGQPFGSGILLWSAAMIAMEVIEERFPWRNFLMDWVVSSGFIAVYLVAMLLFANLSGGATPLRMLPLQLLLSVPAFPIVGRFVAWCDESRLRPFRFDG